MRTVSVARDTRPKTNSSFSTLVSLCLVACLAHNAGAQEAWRPKLAALSPEAACEALNDLAIPASAIGLSTTGATVTSAELVRANARDNANGEFCKVIGRIHPVTNSAPDIEFEVNLPSQWNGKSLQLGGGWFQWCPGHRPWALCQTAFFRRHRPGPGLCHPWQ